MGLTFPRHRRDYLTRLCNDFSICSLLYFPAIGGWVGGLRVLGWEKPDGRCVVLRGGWGGYLHNQGQDKIRILNTPFTSIFLSL